MPVPGGCRTSANGNRRFTCLRATQLPSSSMAMMGARVLTDAARTLRRVLAEVDAGRLDEGGPRGAALRRRLEGAISALQALGRRP